MSRRSQRTGTFSRALEKELQLSTDLSASKNQTPSSTPQQPSTARKDNMSTTSEQGQSSAPVGKLFGYKTAQAGTKAKIAEDISSAEMWIPPKGWRFDINSIPEDKNLPDKVNGLMALAHQEKLIHRKVLGQYKLTFTQAGKVRKDRKRGGAAFKDAKGKHICVGDDQYLNGSEELKPSTYSITTLRNMPDFANFKKALFGAGKISGEKDEGKQKGAAKKRKRAEKDAGSRQEASDEESLDDSESCSDLDDSSDSDDDHDHDDELRPLRRPKEALAKPKRKPDLDFGGDLPSSDSSSLQKKYDELEKSFAVQKLELDNATRDLKEETGKNVKRIKFSKDLVHRSAEAGIHIMKGVMKGAYELAEMFDKNSPDGCGGDYVLEYYDAAMKGIKEELDTARHNSESIQELIDNPSGDKAPKSRHLITPERQAELDRAQEEAIEAVHNRRQAIFDQEVKDSKAKIVAEEEKKIKEQALVQIRSDAQAEVRNAEIAEVEIYKVLIRQKKEADNAAFIKRVQTLMRKDKVDEKEVAALDYRGAWTYTKEARIVMLNDHLDAVKNTAREEGKSEEEISALEWDWVECLRWYREIANDDDNRSRDIARKEVQAAGELYKWPEPW